MDLGLLDKFGLIVGCWGGLESTRKLISTPLLKTKKWLSHKNHYVTAIWI